MENAIVDVTANKLSDSQGRNDGVTSVNQHMSTKYVRHTRTCDMRCSQNKKIVGSLICGFAGLLVVEGTCAQERDSIAAQQPQKEAAPDDGPSLEARGQRLRNLVDAEYNRLKANPNIRANDPKGSDISGIVQQVLPIGMSTDTALRIFEEAGFQIGEMKAASGSSDRTAETCFSATIPALEHGLLWSYYAKASAIACSDGQRKILSLSAVITFPAL